VDAGTYLDSGTVRCVASGLNLAITPAPVTVPAGKLLQSGNSILTRSHLALQLTDSVGPVSGVLLTLRSSRPNSDTFVGPTSATGADGSATADVSTIFQPNVSTIDSTTPLVFTNPKGVVTWLPAKYETPFYVTCYITALESDYSAKLILDATKYKWCGSYVPPSGKKYRDAFMKDVKVQGSGQAIGGEFIQWKVNSACYYVNTCPQTASGACATVGRTVAVDNSNMPTIPWAGTIAVDTLGNRVAEDTGDPKRIVDYHIDEYLGIGRVNCPGAWLNPTLGVSFQNY
jgi:hypothetical protein